MLFILRQLRRLELRQRSGRYFVYAIGEVVLIVIGILIAFQIEGYRTYKNERKEEVRALHALLRDLEISEQGLKEYIERIQDQQAQASSLITFLQQADIPSEKEILEHSKDFLDWHWRPKTSAFNSLRETGKLDLITNTELQSIIVSHFEGMVPYWLENRLEHSERVDHINDLISQDIKYVPDPDFASSGNYHRALVVPPDIFPSDPNFVHRILDFRRSVTHMETRFQFGVSVVQRLRERIESHLETLG